MHKWASFNAGSSLADFERRFHINKVEDWYYVDSEDVTFNNLPLLKVHNYSLFQVLTSVYPDHVWLPWKFVDFYKFLYNPQNLKSFLQYVAKELDFQTMDDWYNVKAEVLNKQK